MATQFQTDPFTDTENFAANLHGITIFSKIYVFGLGIPSGPSGTKDSSNHLIWAL